PEAYWLDLEEIARRAREAWQAGATEVCIQGGLHPEMPGTYYADIVRAVKEAVPAMHVHAFSPFEIQHGARRLGISEREFLIRLKDAGLDTIPGTAAEILDERVRRILTRNKLSAEAWVAIVKTAHSLGIRSTATIMYGHVDGPEDWARHLDLIRRIQKETGGFTEFVPLGFVHWDAPIYRDGTARPGPTGLEDLRMHAVARLMLNETIPNLQVSWVKLGPKFSQVCLMAGANDFGGTLMDETISRSAGAPYGENMPPAEFRRLIREMGRVPVQRTTLYRAIRVFDGEVEEGDEVPAGGAMGRPGEAQFGSGQRGPTPGVVTLQLATHSPVPRIVRGPRPGPRGAGNDARGQTRRAETGL
ncbi:MAG: 5-amino-6-(D-ribitylamino)uracil--L-tyrosine 4-hydroxyphenyl transferase CofH, partial [Clostridia bacterium]|nr:5-amino-6-(D-ribitylamino)uracil--L-tyrosine 4-hydroxyphenyl transferase CofH [Clostridia bacterium]